MAKRTFSLLPATLDILSTMGEQIKQARLRRNISVELLAERADVSTSTVYKVEKGDPNTSIGVYAAILHGIQGMDKDLLLVAQDEILKGSYEQFNWKMPKRAKIIK